MGILESQVLAAAVQLGRDATAVTIRERLAKVRGRAPARGAIYTTLVRLEDRGLVRSALGEPTPVRGGRAQRHYTVTAAGTRALRAEEEATTASARWWRSVLGARR